MRIVIKSSGKGEEQNSLNSSSTQLKIRIGSSGKEVIINSSNTSNKRVLLPVKDLMKLLRR